MKTTQRRKSRVGNSEPQSPIFVLTVDTDVKSGDPKHSWAICTKHQFSSRGVVSRFANMSPEEKSAEQRRVSNIRWAKRRGKSIQRMTESLGVNKHECATALSGAA